MRRIHKSEKVTLVLASESKYRKAQLETLGIPFETLSPLIDEDQEKQNWSNPYLMAQGLAHMKAESLAAPDRIVIGGDQLVHFKGEILGKPKTREGAIAQLQKLQGHTHEIVTGLCVITPDLMFEHLDITKMHMKPLTLIEIEAYVDLDQPLDCAGSYKVEQHGRPLFSEIITQDFSAILGMPLLKLTQFLHNLGYDTKVPS